MSELKVRSRRADDENWIRELLEQRWAGPMIVTRGRVHHADQLPAFVALHNGHNVGLLTYHVAKEQCEIVSLDSVVEGCGVGTALLQTVERAARLARCRRLWLVTTNDNLKALDFYQKRGFVIAAIHGNALESSRKLKPQIPLVGLEGIPLRDEIELERIL